MKTRKRHSGRLVIIGAVMLILLVVWAIVRAGAPGDSRPDGSTAERRIEFIRSFGWEVGIAPTSITEIRIPSTFDEAYEQYNALQREQGFDLRRYKACYAYKYTYDIENYTASEKPSPVPICASLIVYEGKIIGADISSAEADGLVTVLVKK